VGPGHGHHAARHLLLLLHLCLKLLLPLLLPPLDDSEIPVNAVRQAVRRLLAVWCRKAVVAHIPTSPLDEGEEVEHLQVAREGLQLRHGGGWGPSKAEISQTKTELAASQFMGPSLPMRTSSSSTLDQGSFPWPMLVQIQIENKLIPLESESKQEAQSCYRLPSKLL